MAFLGILYFTAIAYGIAGPLVLWLYILCITVKRCGIAVNNTKHGQ